MYSLSVSDTVLNVLFHMHAVNSFQSENETKAVA